MSPATSHLIDEYEPLLISLQTVLGIVVPDGKHTQMLAVLKPVLDEHGMKSYFDLARRLQGNDAEQLRTEVLDLITEEYADWSLSEETRTILHKYVLEQLPVKARIWIVGCGRGQLAYTLAMEIANHERISGEKKNYDIHASDVPLIDIQAAKSAIYTDSQLTGMSEEYKRLHMTQADGGGWQVRDKIRERVQFSQCDLTQDFQSIGHMDLIICPNLLAYYSNGVKESVLTQFSSLLKPGGILLTDNNQSVTPFYSGFDRVEHPAGIFYRQKG